MGLYGKDGQVLIIFVMRSILQCVYFEEAGGLIRVNSCTGNVNISSFSHVINFGRNKLNSVKFSCL